MQAWKSYNKAPRGKIMLFKIYPHASTLRLLLFYKNLR
jgi:hypothetical protein